MHTNTHTHTNTHAHTVWCILVLYLDPGSERFKVSFTMRDSPSDYVNVTCWGSEQYIRGIAGSFKICDVGEWPGGELIRSRDWACEH